MNSRMIKIIFTKDWRELGKSKQAVLPMVIVPIIFVIVMPAILILSSLGVTMTPGNVEFLKALPSDFFPAGYNLQQGLVYVMIVHIFAPLFLLIPVMASGIIAASSFAGEKERKTIEGLLYTPISDKELVMGKILVSLIPAVLITWVSFIVYTVVVNSLGYAIFQHLFFPTASWLVLIFWLAPAISFLSLAFVVYVSQRATGVWEAQQVSALLVLPIITLVISSVKGLIQLRWPVIFFAGLIVLIIDLFIYRWLVRKLDRERIVTKLV
ncbi:MAG: ABC transporter permease subunit [bacterium]